MHENDVIGVRKTSIIAHSLKWLEYPSLMTELRKPAKELKNNKEREGSSTVTTEAKKVSPPKVTWKKRKEKEKNDIDLSKEDVEEEENLVK